MNINLTLKEWLVISNICNSWTLHDLARNAGLAYTTTRVVFLRLKEKGLAYFMPNYRNMNLVPVFYLTTENITEVPPYVSSIRYVFGLGRRYILITGIVPAQYIQKFRDMLPEGYFVRGYEYIRWKANSYISYVEKSKKIIPMIRKLSNDIYNFYYPVEKYHGLKAPDKIDLIILHGKMIDPFMNVVETLRLAKKYDATIKDYSKQLLSYHTSFFINGQLNFLHKWTHILFGNNFNRAFVTFVF